MMQHKEFKGRKIKYRHMLEAELGDRDREAAYHAQSRAMGQREHDAALVAMARRDRPAFERLARWIVATCRTGTERQIGDVLESQGIECWIPTERRQKPPRRGQKAVEIQVPVFRGYLFVRVIPDNEAYAGLLSAAKLNGLMSSGGKVYLMPEKLMERLRLVGKKRERKQIDAADLPALKKAIGKPAAIRSGPFADFMVTIRRVLEKRGELVVELPIVGGLVEMTIDVDSIRL